MTDQQQGHAKWLRETASNVYLRRTSEAMLVGADAIERLAEIEKELAETDAELDVAYKRDEEFSVAMGELLGGQVAKDVKAQVLAVPVQFLPHIKALTDRLAEIEAALAGIGSLLVEDFGSGDKIDYVVCTQDKAGAEWIVLARGHDTAIDALLAAYRASKEGK